MTTRPGRGIPDPTNYGDIDKLRPGAVLDFVVQRHLADRAGPHYDLRMGNREMGLFSGATKSELPKPGERVSVHQTPIHKYDYKDYEGKLRGYGAGSVSKHDEGKVLITKVTDNAIHFSTAHGQAPKRYALVKPKGGSRSWLLIHGHNPARPDVTKPKFEIVHEDEIEQKLESLGADDMVQAKIDGAMNLIDLHNDKAEVMSYRESKKHPEHPILHTERFFGGDPTVKVPAEFKDSVLLGEVFGQRGNRAIPQRELSGLLNTNIADSITQQRQLDTKLKAMIFDVAKMKNQDLSQTPYSERFEILKKMFPYLPNDKFVLPETVKGPEAAKALLERIRKGKHNLTQEGIVIHPSDGPAAKYKVTPDFDVHVRNIFQGDRKYRNAAGGFEYSREEKGPVVGRVGTGFSDRDRDEMWKRQKDFVNRVATVRAQGEFPSGALRAPVYQGFHEAK